MLINSTGLKINTKQFQTKNFKGVLSLLAGNTLAKLILTIGGFFLVNFYGPENYAVYGVFLSYVMILPVLASFRLENIMILQQGSSEIKNLFTGILLISFGCVGILISILCLLKGFGMVNIDLSYFILFLCGIGALLTAWNNIQHALFTKFKLFKQISTAFILASLFSVGFQCVFYFAGWESHGLIYGWLIGLAASFVYNALVAKGRMSKFDFRLFRQSVKQHFEVVKFTYPSDSINTIANNILPILVIGYFAKSEVGLYLMAFKILSTPLLIITSSVSRVYFQKSVTLFHHDKKGLEQLTFRVVYSNLGLIALFVLFMNSVGVYLLDILLKDDWKDLEKYILLLSFWIVARSTFNPIASILMVIKKNHYSLVFNIYLLLVNLIAVYAGIMTQDFEKCVLAFSILSGTGYLVLTILILVNLNRIKKKNEA